MPSGTLLAEGILSALTSATAAQKRCIVLEELGIKLTPAGATFPYRRDPRDRNLRIAPTYPPIEELKKAVDALCVCVKIACIEKILAEK